MQRLCSFVCTIPAPSLPKAIYPGPAQRANSWPIFSAFLCLLPSATLAFMVLAWGAHASPSVQSHMLPKRTAKSTQCSAAQIQPWRLVWGLLSPTWLLGNSLAASTGPGLHMVVVPQERGYWPGAPDGLPGQSPVGTAPGQAQVLRKVSMSKTCQARGSYSLWISRPWGGDTVQKN